MNPWLEQVHATLPRVLALFDVDPLSPTRGIGDRFHWAWKLIDFGNATFQGAAHGLARLVHAGLLPEWVHEQKIIEIIDAIFDGTKKLTYPDGSLEEAFPHERSFCVTALVAYDLLSCIDLLCEKIDEQKRAEYIEIVRPLIRFLKKSDETHGVISNHLATAAAALIKWRQISQENDVNRGLEILERVFSHQSSEGWYQEYEGADPGYMSLAICYLADIYQMNPTDKLRDSLNKAVGFLTYCAHPDGSFGGHYGSRNTRFYYPAGIAMLAASFDKADMLHAFMRKSIMDMTCVTLLSMDEPNLIPMFNAYVRAAQVDSLEKSDLLRKDNNLPFNSMVPLEKYFSDAGLLVVNRPHYYALFSLFKGGIGSVFYKDGDVHHVQGAALVNGKKRLYSNQLYCSDNKIIIEKDFLEITSEFNKINNSLLLPWQMIVLRTLNLTIMRFRFFSDLIKVMLVKMLITGHKSLGVFNKRRVVFGETVVVEDSLEGPLKNINELKILNIDQPFRSIHMASSGYWQRQDTLK